MKWRLLAKRSSPSLSSTVAKNSSWHVTSVGDTCLHPSSPGWMPAASVTCTGRWLLSTMSFTSPGAATMAIVSLSE